MQKRIILNIDSRVHEEFQKFCKDNDIITSKRVKRLMNQERESCILCVSGSPNPFLIEDSCHRIADQSGRCFLETRPEDGGARCFCDLIISFDISVGERYCFFVNQNKYGS